MSDGPNVWMWLPALLLWALNCYGAEPGAGEVLLSYERVMPFSNPAYSITIFKGGRVLYEGHKSVKTLGIRELFISESKVQALRSVLEKKNVLSFQPRPIGPSAEAMLDTAFYLALEGKSRNITFSATRNNEFVFWLEDLIESTAGTAELRCPFEAQVRAGVRIEYCAAHEAVAEKFRSIREAD